MNHSMMLLHRICMKWWQSPIQLAYADSLLGQWLAESVRDQNDGAELPASIPSGMGDDPWLVESVIKANMHLGKIITVDDWADLLHITKRQLYAKFQTISTQSPKVLLNAIKLQKAEAMLKQQHSIHEISLHCGFNSRRAFTRWFKAQTGYPPNQYLSE